MSKIPFIKAWIYLKYEVILETISSFAKKKKKKRLFELNVPVKQFLDSLPSSSIYNQKPIKNYSF
ncbi:hypothetical protein [Ureaplasma diversum]|uniref:hypothetical protein n=1 Tax=Ureaplasma diversum TaxID=42094 RepID=UPI000AF9AA3D|nr:hypothetical protein [Ureaplasma diversum]